MISLKFDKKKLKTNAISKIHCWIKLMNINGQYKFSTTTTIEILYLILEDQ